MGPDPAKRHTPVCQFLHPCGLLAPSFCLPFSPVSAAFSHTSTRWHPARWVPAATAGTLEGNPTALHFLPLLLSLQPLSFFPGSERLPLSKAFWRIPELEEQSCGPWSPLAPVHPKLEFLHSWPPALAGSHLHTFSDRKLTTL